MLRVVHHSPSNDARVSHRSCDQPRRQVDLGHLGRTPPKAQFTHDRPSLIRSWKMACFGQSWEEAERKEPEPDLIMKSALLSSPKTHLKTHTCVRGGVSIWLSATERAITASYCWSEEQIKGDITTDQLRQEITISLHLPPPTAAK